MYPYCRFTVGCLMAWLVLLPPSAARAEDQGASHAMRSAPNSLPENLRFFSDHIQFLATEGGNRYRYIDKAARKVNERDLQYKVSSRVRIKLIGEDTTFIEAHGDTGRTFTSGYDYTGIGRHNTYWSFNLKSLFLAQKIGPHFEAQAGGIEYDWGAGTEATYADNDAWLEGYRLRYAGQGRHGLPNAISATVGYVGDFNQPNAFARLHRMADENYVQILAAKRFVKNTDASAEFDSLQNVSYTREALHSRKLPLFIVDELLVEAITRASDDRTFGWSSSLFRTLGPKGILRLGVFYSDMPNGIFLKGKKNTVLFLNGDSYVTGKRIGPTIRITPMKNFELSFFGSDRLDRTPGARYRGQVVARYQFAGLLNRMLLEINVRRSLGR